MGFSQSGKFPSWFPGSHVGLSQDALLSVRCLVSALAWCAPGQGKGKGKTKDTRREPGRTLGHFVPSRWTFPL